MQQSRDDDAEPAIHSTFDDRHSGKSSLYYTALSMAMDDLNFSRVLNCRKPMCVGEQKADDKYKHVAPFLRALHNRHERCANVFISKRSLLLQ